MKAVVGFFLTWSSMSLSLAMLLPACGGGGTKSEWPKGNVVLEGTNNYTSTANLLIPQIPTASGADLTVCWNDLMKDLLCHNIEAPSNAVDNVGFLQIPNMTQDQVRASLAVGQLDENRVKIYREHHTTAADNGCAKLSTFMLGTVLNPTTDYVEPVSGQTLTYMLLFTSGTTPGVGSKAMAFLEPMAASTVMDVAAPDACSNSVLDFHATFGAPINIPKDDNTKWHVDWSQIANDSFGNPINFAKIDMLQLGFYQNMDATQLAANFKDIEQIATKFYEVPVEPGARDADLVNAKDKATGAAFPGFTQTDGTWAVAVRCSKCQIPAPVVLSVLTLQ